jgi:hypothetical protein
VTIDPEQQAIFHHALDHLASFSVADVQFLLDCEMLPLSHFPFPLSIPFHCG